MGTPKRSVLQLPFNFLKNVETQDSGFSNAQNRRSVQTVSRQTFPTNRPGWNGINRSKPDTQIPRPSCPSSLGDPRTLSLALAFGLTFMSVMTCWKSPPSAEHSLSSAHRSTDDDVAIDITPAAAAMTMEETIYQHLLTFVATFQSTTLIHAQETFTFSLLFT